MTYNQPSKASAQLHSVKGSAVEAVGNMTGSSEWQTAGKKEHAGGEAEYKAAQAEGYAQGTADRLTGYKDSVLGAVTGDKARQASGNVKKDKGRVQQEINNPN